MTKKTLISNILVIFVLSTLFSTYFATTSFAAKNHILSIKYKQDVFVYDEDNQIDDDVEKSINQLLIALEDKTEVEVAVISIPSLNNLTIEEYAVELFNTLGIGKKGKDNGVLLLFSKSDNKVRLEIGRGLEGCLNDGKCGRILDNYFVPYREEGNYTEAARITTNAVIKVVSEEYEVSIEGAEDIHIPDEDDDMPTWLIILIIALLVLVFIAEQSSGGSSGGGYYGGSSGSFSSRSGFGGGRTGGGGASR